ncbi:PCYCGC motif-containing (lipo)protein [Virgibacillus sp. W0430]|uniref:PCYCGC motif-containing (lipo)protein n=1 Tax=Virgibacillus sp. W0430 TaxID=3391580 RepID=UPI003F4489F9
MKRITILLSIFVLSVTSACTSEESQEHSDHQHNTPIGDIREETESVNDLPAFLDKQSTEMQTLYQAVAHSQDLLELIPCYCGCGNDSIGHKDNYDCFIFDNHADGSLTWDDHATKCQACLDIAAKSIIEFNNGKTVKEIRHLIDEQYKEGYAEPTPTPEA